MDFIALCRYAAHSLIDALYWFHAALHSGAMLPFAKCCGDGKQSQSGQFAAVLTAVRIQQTLSQHLIAAADAKNAAALQGGFLYARFQAVLSYPQQIRHGIFAAGQEQNIRFSQLLRRIYIPDGNALAALQHAEIRKIGDMRETDNRRIDPFADLSSVKPFRKAVFVVDIQLRVGNHPGYGNTAFVIQLLQSGIQDGFIPPEFIDHKSFNPGPLLFLQKPDGTQQLGKYAAAVDIPHQQQPCVPVPY